MKQLKRVKDPDIRGAEPALQRAALAARRIARITGTPLVIWKNGKIVRLPLGNTLTRRREGD
ncbi:MAG: hypothetical protein ACI9OU_002075 [Candidatus Promineifilaceae bacterium]|jgi:hypothetical protein